MRRFEVIADLANRHGWRRGVEVGVQKGATFFWLLDHCPLLTLTGVDIFEPRPDKSDGWTYIRDDLPGQYRRIVERLVQGGYGGRGNLIKAWSVDAARTFGDASLDFVFIDADHTAPGIRADIAAWAPKVRAGGFITGHDYCPAFPDVVRAVDELLPGAAAHDDSVWSIAKAQTGWA